MQASARRSRLNFHLSLMLAGAVLAPSAPAVLGEEEPEAKTVGQALKKGSVSLGLRYRFENVDQDTPSLMGREANASTLRTALTYRSARVQGFGVGLGFENVTALGLDDDYNNRGAGSLFNGVGNRPAIVDPEITELALATLSYRAPGAATVSLGRDEINLGGQRFVGAVGWRQHHQTFDQLRVDVEAISKTKLTYAYIDRVHRIFGDAQPMSSHALLAEISVTETGSLSTYLYSLDYDNPSSAGLSTRTLGARWQARPQAGSGWKLPYQLEYATQSDTGDNPGNVEAAYALAQLEAHHSNGLRLQLGYELLEGNATDGAFSTPLATLHKWNGWADLFLATPSAGLVDSFLGVGYANGPYQAMAIYHDFAPDSGSGDYGTEIDAVFSYKAKWGQTFAAKLARYETDGFGVDTNKVWLYTTYGFGVN